MDRHWKCHGMSEKQITKQQSLILSNTWNDASTPEFHLNVMNINV